MKKLTEAEHRELQLMCSKAQGIAEKLASVVRYPHLEHDFAGMAGMARKLETELHDYYARFSPITAPDTGGTSGVLPGSP